MTTIIRPFQSADVSDANALTNIYIRDTPIHFAFEPAADGDFRDAWQALQPRYPWLAATVDDRFAGYARAGPWRTRDAYRFTAETSVYIHPDFHRRGLGRSLMLKLLAQLTSAGFHTAIAGATLPNPASAALHEALGFRHVGTFREVGCKFDKWWDVGFWQKQLISP